MGKRRESRLKKIIDNKIPAVVCSQFEDRFIGYNVSGKRLLHSISPKIHRFN